VPAIPWRAGKAVDPDATHVAMVSYLPLARKQATLEMIRFTRQVMTELAAAPGLAGFALDAHPFSGDYWTLSAWADEAALLAFVGQPHHRAAIAGLRPSLGDTALARWQVLGRELPLAWPDAKARLRG
jgi:quinol monooxygenase YgiN